MSASSTAVVTPATIRGRRLPRTPGRLIAERGRLEFRTVGARVFRVPLAEVEAVAWPWWWFGRRLVVTVRGECYRISFGSNDDEPRSDSDSGSSADASSDLDLLFAVIGLVQAVMSLGGGSDERSAARRWREILPPTA